MQILWIWQLCVDDFVDHACFVGLKTLENPAQTACHIIRWKIFCVFIMLLTTLKKKKNRGKSQLANMSSSLLRFARMWRVNVGVKNAGFCHYLFLLLSSLILHNPCNRMTFVERAGCLPLTEPHIQNTVMTAQRSARRWSSQQRKSLWTLSQPLCSFGEPTWNWMYEKINMSEHSLRLQWSRVGIDLKGTRNTEGALHTRLVQLSGGEKMRWKVHLKMH